MQDDFELLGQINVKHGASRIAVLPDRRHLLVSAGLSKPDNVAFVNLDEHKVIWTRSLSSASARVVALRAGCLVAATDSGRVGAGRSDLEFLSTAGDRLAAASLPDKLTEVRRSGDLVVAGCRDGHLYCYDASGKLQWSHRVPPLHLDPLDDPTSRPCPYFIETLPEGERIVFSFLDTTYMLSTNGELLWKWRARSKPERITFPTAGGQEIAMYSSGIEPIVYGLQIGHDGRSCLVATSNGKLTFLTDHGRPAKQVSVEEGPSRIAGTSDLSRIAYAHWKGVSFYDSSELLSVYPAKSLYKLRTAPDDRHVAAWAGKSVRFFGFDGVLRAEQEFPRTVTDVAFVNSTELVVASGKVSRIGLA